MNQKQPFIGCKNGGNRKRSNWRKNSVTKTPIQNSFRGVSTVGRPETKLRLPFVEVATLELGEISSHIHQKASKTAISDSLVPLCR